MLLLAYPGGVELAGTVRLDIGAGAIRTGFGELGRGQLLARNPVEMAVIGAARGEGAALAFGDQLGRRRWRLRLAARRLGGARCAHGAAAVYRARWQGLTGFIGRAIPAAGGVGLARALFGCEDPRYS